MLHDKLYAERMEVVKPSAIRELLALANQPDIISFGGGFPDPTLFPTEKLINVFTDVMRNNGGTALQYTSSDGLPSLREKLCARMKKTGGVDCTIENLFIIQGGQQGMDLVAKLFIDKGDVIVTERPTFLGGLIAFNQYQPQYKCCSMDKDGMNMDELEEILKTTKKVKFIYTIPDFQNPMGVCMSLERKKRLLALASKYNVIVLEDTPYREIRYEGEHVPTIKSMDKEERVIFLGSFSKILSPGMRLGWVVAPKEIAAKMVLLKMAADTQCSTLNMWLVDRFMDMYNIDEHIEVLRSAYLRKRNVMLKAMQEAFPASCSWTIPQGGLFTWLTINPKLDSEKVMKERILPEARAAYVPGAGFFPLNVEHNHARVNYSCVPDEKIIEGINKVGAILKQLD